jgi:Mn-dependent DtxR family transcriptional regulator
MIRFSRTSFILCIDFLSCVGDGLNTHDIKEKLGLSRYSYEYTLNRILRLELVAYEGGKLRLTEKGANVLRYSVGASARHDVTELKIAQQCP